MVNKLIHITFSIILAALVTVIPCAVFLDIFKDMPPDAVSQASMTLPDEPSGEFVVYLNTSLHEDTTGDWIDFFNDEYAVIFDDISCITAIGDVSGQQLAERFQAQLPENQMTVRSEDATLLASKLDAGLVDIAVLSKEMADALKLSDTYIDIAVVTITGGADNEKV